MASQTQVSSVFLFCCRDLGPDLKVLGWCQVAQTISEISGQNSMLQRLYVDHEAETQMKQLTQRFYCCNLQDVVQSTWRFFQEQVPDQGSGDSHDCYRYVIVRSEIINLPEGSSEVSVQQVSLMPDQLSGGNSFTQCCCQKNHRTTT